MKKWLIDGFLPMWAKQTVLQDNQNLLKQLQSVRHENRELRAYIEGLERGIRTAMRLERLKAGAKK